MNTYEEFVTPLEKLVGVRDGKLDPDVPGNVPDIVIDGGGMKCVVGAAILRTMHDEGLLQPVKRIRTLSGGTPNGLVVITEQHNEIQEAYESDLVDGGLIDYWRLAKRKPIVRLQVLEELLRERLNTNAIKESPIELVFGVTKLDDGLEPISINTKEIDESEIITWTMRGMHLPRVAGTPEPDDSGIRYVDGGLSWPLTRDLAPDSTSILNISNVPPPKEWLVDMAQTDFFGRWLCRFGGPRCLEMFRAFAISQAKIINSGVPTHVQILHPSAKAELPGTLETDKRKLRAGYIAGQNAVYAALEKATVEAPARREPSRSIVATTKRQVASWAGPRALSAAFSIIP